MVLVALWVMLWIALESTVLQTSTTISFKRQAIAQLYAGKGFSGKDGVFGSMMKDILETALGEELNHHLKQEKEQFCDSGDDFNCKIWSRCLHNQNIFMQIYMVVFCGFGSKYSNNFS